ncbi:MAG: ABC-2 transporter permease [Lachnospiraceae bacterium]|nr:ABC-2 transporter permease [Lachnospiraceae bacterium]
MRVFKYMMVDFLKVKKKLFIFLILVPAFGAWMGMGKGNTEVSFVFALSYCMFAGIIMAGLPYQYEKAEENGFLYMLPGKTQEQVFGHFLFGFACMLMGYLLGILCGGIGFLLRPQESFFSMGELSGFSDFIHVSFLLLGAGLLVVTVQDLLCTIFQFESVQVMNLMRILPGFLFFFGGMIFMEGGADRGMEALTFLYRHSAMFFLACVLIFLVVAYIGGRIATGRE